MAGDPPLDQVVTRTVEAGVRGGAGALSWNAGVFHADNSRRHPVRRVGRRPASATSRTSARRAGRASSSAQRPQRARHGRRRLHVARRDVPERRNGQRHRQQHERRRAAGLEGTIDIAAGRSHPADPAAHVQGVCRRPGHAEALGRRRPDRGRRASFARGNENNAHAAGRHSTISGPARRTAYAVVNLGAHYQLHRGCSCSRRSTTCSTPSYYTAAQLGATGFTSTGNFIARPFPAVDGEFPVQQADVLRARRADDGVGRPGSSSDTRDPPPLRFRTATSSAAR